MKIILAITSIFTLFIFVSCEEVIDVPLTKGSEKYVVEGYVSTEKGETKVILTKTTDYYNTEIPKVNNAFVTIFDGTQKDTLIESTVNSGVYFPKNTDFVGKLNKTYQLNIVADGKTFTAEDYLAPVPVLDSILITKNIGGGEKKYNWILIYMQDPANETNFYKWNIYVEDKYLSGFEYISINDDRTINGSKLNGDYPIYSDFFAVSNKDEEQLQKGRKIFVKQLSLSEKVFQYYTQLSSQSQGGGNLFSVPPANIKGNITGAIGVFTCSDVSKSPVRIVE